MSVCISQHGEFSSHEPDVLHTCTLCGVLDEDALRAELVRVDWYRRRVKALEGLLVCYRVGGRPSEKLHKELELTGQHIGHDGAWRG